MKEESIIKELLNSMPQTGSVAGITIRPKRRVEPTEQLEVIANEEAGLEGDHFSSTYSKKRQVTLIQAEHLDVVASILEKTSVELPQTRRNILVKGINLLALMNREFEIGEAVLRCTGYCEPCNRMEENLGPGGYNAMRGHGGITAEVVKGGLIRKGDQVRLVAN